MTIQVEKRVKFPYLVSHSYPRVTNVSLVLQRVGGKDASKQFWKYHSPAVLKRYKGKLQVGSLDSKKAAAPAAPPATPSPAKEQAVTTTSGPIGKKAPLDVYGDLVPFADPSWYQGVSCHASLSSPLKSAVLKHSIVSFTLLQRVPQRSPR